MSDYKGTGVVFVRKAVEAAGEDAVRRFREALSEEERATLDRTVATDWVSIEFVTKLFEASAPILYPGKPTALRLVGQALARDNLQGVYRYLVRVLTIPFVLDQSAKLWHTYHRRGEPELLREGSHACTFVVRRYPRLPERFRECMCGYILETIGLAGGRDALVAKNDEDAEAWAFRCSWK